MEHLTRACREFISWFGQQKTGFLYMLTKSDNVDGILNLPHNGHSILTWSLNQAEVSEKYEIGAPAFERRLEAARKVQNAGYRFRIRLDPIVPIDGWKEAYRRTIGKIFETIAPESVTIGTLRFEEGLYKMRNTFFQSPELVELVDSMVPMFQPKVFPGMRKPKAGNYSFSEGKRAEIFSFAIAEIRKYSDCPIALCKESSSIWNMVGLDLSKCQCACQLNSVDMTLLGQIEGGETLL